MQKDPESVRAGFAEMYTGNPPWEIGRPQPPFLEIADQVTGPLLDVGCGTGNTSLYFAARGQQVTGVDFVAEAIDRGKAKAAERGLSIEFLVKDARTLAQWDRRFASVIDSGLYHIYSSEVRQPYVQGLAHVLQPGGRVFLLAFSDEEPAAPGGGISLEDLSADFANGWEIESVQTYRGEINPAYASEFLEEGPKMRFAIIRRTA